jgi:preprotein translocase subunit SecE
MKLTVYKKGQGSMGRLLAGIGMALLALFGCISLYNYKDAFDISQTPPQPTLWGTPLYQIPVVEFNITWGLIISGLIFLISLFLIYILIINKPRTADFLIETEAETRKVSWPSKPEHVGSTVAVIISVLMIGGFLLIMDSLLAQLMKLIRFN